MGLHRMLAAMPSLLFIGVACLFSWTSASAQEFGRVGELSVSGASYYTFVRAGEPSVQVTVLGDVGAAGIYEITTHTNISELLALTGGEILGPELQRERREVTVHVFRPEGTQRVPIFEAPLEEIITHLNEFPSLMDGDIVWVETVIHEKRNWFEVARTAAAFATLALATERLVRVLFY